MSRESGPEELMVMAETDNDAARKPGPAEQALDVVLGDATAQILAEYPDIDTGTLANLVADRVRYLAADRVEGRAALLEVT